MNFSDADLLEQLEASDAAQLEAANFGIIAMDAEGVVRAYNVYESKLSGLSVGRVIGNHFFTAVAPCTNNFMVAQRFEAEATLDATIDYVFTLKMRPTPVKLRLLKAVGSRWQYLLVSRS